MLRRVADTLSDLGSPALAVGGLAARAWGGTRDLVDLDFYVPLDVIPMLARALAPSAAGGPVHVKGAHWDLTLLRLDLDGCAVEFGAAEDARWRDARTGAWRSAAIDFSRHEMREIFGVRVPVMLRDELIAYKAALDRDVDAIDLHDLIGAGGPVENRIAVYGTLAPGEVNHGMLSSLGGAWTPTTINGHRHDAGWGMTHGFPALVWNPDAPAIAAHLLKSPHLPRHWTHLDAFEGPAYRRQVLPVHTKRGRVLANAYTVRWPQ